MIVLKGLMENVRVFARHVKGVKNVLADSLSRNKINCFKEECMEQGRNFDPAPTSIPQVLWPMDHIWKK